MEKWTGSLNRMLAPKHVGGVGVATRGKRCSRWKSCLDPTGGEDANAVAALVVDLAEAFETVQLIVVWQWTMHVVEFHTKGRS